MTRLILYFAGALFVPACGTAAYVHAASQPESEWTCTFKRDFRISPESGPVSVRTCTSWGFTMQHVSVLNDEARLVGRCGDQILYFNREEDFPDDCLWIESTPTVFGARP